MKNTYKIFGAAAIIGLFLLSSLGSTSLAITQNQKPQTDAGLGIEPGIQDEYVIADYDDPAYTLDGYPDETLAYDPNSPIFGHGSDLATTIIACFPLTDILWVRVRNVGTTQSEGGKITIKVYAFVSLKLFPILKIQRSVTALPAWILAQNFIEGPVAFTQPVHLVTSDIDPYAYEGIGRHISYRVGWVQDIL